MRLTIKLVLWFFACVVVAVGVSAVVNIQGELDRYESNLAQHHTMTGLVLREAFSEVMITEGEDRAVSVLTYTDKSQPVVDIRWLYPETVPELGGPTLDRIVHVKRDGRLRSYVPVHIEGRKNSALELSAPLDSREIVRYAVTRELRVVGAVALAIGIAAGILGLLFVARPIQRLIEHARRIGEGDFSPSPLDPQGKKDELEELGREMNAMCLQLSDAQATKLRTLEQLRHAERLSTVGKLASGLAHELGTPLNVITLRAGAIAQGRAVGEKASDAATTIADQAVRMTNLVRQLLDFARSSRVPQNEKVSLDKVVTKATSLIASVATKSKVKVDTDLAADVLVRGDAGQLEQVMTNLLINAIHAMSPSDEGGTVSIKTTVEGNVVPPADIEKSGSSSYVKLSVKDTGSGIAADVLPHIFEPFFTTKPVGEGTGLGLSVCWGIVRDHGGWIDVTSSATGGTEFSVYLPRIEG